MERNIEELMSDKQPMLISITEAATLSGIGINKLYKLTKKPDCPWAFQNGSRVTLVKRQVFVDFILNNKGV